MTAEKILQSDMLDILFEGRNKLYGAYELRRTYHRQLKKGIGGMILFIALLAGTYLLSFGKQNISAAGLAVVDSITLTEIKDPSTPPAPPPPPPPPQSLPPEATISYTAPLIVANLPETEVSRQSDIDTAAISTLTTTGIAATGVVAPAPVTGTTGGDGPPAELPSNPASAIPAGPVDMGLVDVMPEYPGGRQALINYMIRLLSSELEPGQKFVLRAQFIINQDGQVSDVSIISSDDPTLNNQVLTAIRRMKAWKPGVLHGQKVAVRFTMPVTFVGAEE